MVNISFWFKLTTLIYWAETYIILKKNAKTLLVASKEVVTGEWRRLHNDELNDLYGCETWSLTLREESKLRVFENKVLRRIFAPRRDEITGDWRRLHNEELNDLYSSPNLRG